MLAAAKQVRANGLLKQTNETILFATGTSIKHAEPIEAFYPVLARPIRMC